MANLTFTPRLSRPESGNPYYNTRGNGGYSNAIKGKPTDPGCDVLANCVGYAYGRFNEIGGWGSCKYLSPVNAENFIQYARGLEVGMTPRVGACMVWRKGATLSNADGAGHVAIVEKVVSSTQVLTSESGWNCVNPFWTKTRNKGADGNWGAGAGYTFLGFIYNPAPCCGGSDPQSSTATGGVAVPLDGQSYTVKSGDTLGAIAAKYGLHYMTLAKYNNLANPNYLYVGQVIRIPKTEATNDKQTTGDAAWTPQKGDKVIFTGNVHYNTANSDTPLSCKGGLARITIGPFQPGKSKHPYHVVSMEAGCTVYGWVDTDTLQKAD